MDGSSFSLVWDSNSTLYDSLDVTSIKHQLDSAIAGGRSLADPSLEAAAENGRKKQSRLSKSLQKLVRLVFRWKRREMEVRLKLAQRYADDSELYGCSYPVRWSGGGGLASIPEVSEKALESPEFDYSAVRRAVSERFPTARLRRDFQD